jgi:predicted RNase H-like HicB family nuclease
LTAPAGRSIVEQEADLEGDMKLTAIIEREGAGFVSLCPELDIASQGDSVEAARDNLQEALELFFETASAEEIAQRLRGEVFVTQVEVAVG